MIPHNILVLTSLVLTCVVFADTRGHRSGVTPRTVLAGAAMESGEPTVNLVAKWKVPYNPATGTVSGKVKNIRASSTVEVPPVLSDSNAVDDEGGDDYDDVFSEKKVSNGLWEEEFGSGIDEFNTDYPEITKSTTRRPIMTPARTRAPVPSHPSRKPIVATSPTRPTLPTPPPVKVPPLSTADPFCDTDDNGAPDEDSDDDIFGTKHTDWIEGDDENLGDDIFGKVNSSWTWGRYPESATDTLPGVPVETMIATKLTPEDELKMKEAIVQALRPLTLSPCAGRRQQDPKCKTLKDVIRDLSLMGLVFTSGRP